LTKNFHFFDNSLYNLKVNIFSLLSKVSFWVGISVVSLWLVDTFIFNFRGHEDYTGGLATILGLILAIVICIVSFLFAWLLKSISKRHPADDSLARSIGLRTFITIILVICVLFLLMLALLFFGSPTTREGF